MSKIKPGALCFIVAPATINVGRTVEVIERAPDRLNYDGVPNWYVRSSGLMGQCTETGDFKFGPVGEVLEPCLRPISDGDIDVDAHEVDEVAA